jgi:hypothetical protein
VGTERWYPVPPPSGAIQGSSATVVVAELQIGVTNVSYERPLESEFLHVGSGRSSDKQRGRKDAGGDQ